MFKNNWVGDAAITLFLLMQCFDGVLTYVGVVWHGIDIEANPIVFAMMTEWGGYGLLGAKVAASLLGILLYYRKAHWAVLLLTGFYFTAAIIPWINILF